MADTKESLLNALTASQVDIDNDVLPLLRRYPSGINGDNRGLTVRDLKKALGLPFASISLILKTGFAATSGTTYWINFDTITANDGVSVGRGAPIQYIPSPQGARWFRARAKVAWSNTTVNTRMAWIVSTDPLTGTTNYHAMFGDGARNESIHTISTIGWEPIGSIANQGNAGYRNPVQIALWMWQNGAGVSIASGDPASGSNFGGPIALTVEFKA